MKKSLKGMLSVVISAVMVVSSMAFGSFDIMGAVTNYEAGPNITASFDSSTGVLTLSGTGATYDFRNTTSSVLGTRQTPWTKVKPNIKSVVVGEGITTIGDFCFYDCSALTSVSLPSTLKAINGSGLRDSQTTSFGAFRDCISLEEISFPAGLQTIGQVSFRGCTSLESVIIPDSVTTLGAAAFTGCTSLRNVTFGSGITEVPLEAFYGDTNIKVINWGANITEIGEWAFYNCGMNAVDLPDTITKVSARGFADCYFLLRATINNPNCDIANLAFNNTRLTQPQDFTVVGHTGSTAQTFAESRNYTFVSLDDCDHESTRVHTLVSPTCTEKGRAELICNACERSVSEYDVNALGHDYVEVSTSDDTEIDGHIRQYTECSRCEDEKVNITHVETEESTTLRRRYVWVDGHYTISTRGNCQTGVVSTYSCSVEGCRAVQIMEAAASGHDVREWTVITEPTCTEEGLKRGVCVKCDAQVDEAIKPAGHQINYADYDQVVDKTEENGHIYRYYPCQVCGEHDVKMEHVEWMELYFTPNVLLPATCNTDGRARDTCDICGETRDITIPNMGGHDWVETTRVEPTCTGREQINYQCSKCGLTKAERGEALGHDLVKTDGGSKLPTCTEDGSNAYECTRCSYTTSEVVPALGHDSDEEAYKLVVAPTCEKEGRATSTCKRCKLDYDEVVPALGHEYEDVNVDIPEEPGHALVTPSCIRCNTIKTGKKVHVEWLDEYTTSRVVIEQSCIAGDTIQDTCTLCGETKTRVEGEGATHELKFLAVINTTGTITYTCKHCALITRVKASDVFQMWDNQYYNTVPDGRIVDNPSTFLDVNGDNFINAKDYALLRNMYKQAQNSTEPEEPENPEESGEENGEGENGNIRDIINGWINDRRGNN